MSSQSSYINHLLLEWSDLTSFPCRPCKNGDKLIWEVAAEREKFSYLTSGSQLSFRAKLADVWRTKMEKKSVEHAGFVGDKSIIDEMSYRDLLWKWANPTENWDSSGICRRTSSVTRWTPRCCGLKLILLWNQAEPIWMPLELRLDPGPPPPWALSSQLIWKQQGKFNNSLFLLFSPENKLTPLCHWQPSLQGSDSLAHNNCTVQVYHFTSCLVKLQTQQFIITYTKTVKNTCLEDGGGTRPAGQFEVEHCRLWCWVQNPSLLFSGSRQHCVVVSPSVPASIFSLKHPFPLLLLLLQLMMRAGGGWRPTRLAKTFRKRSWFSFISCRAQSRRMRIAHGRRNRP